MDQKCSKNWPKMDQKWTYNGPTYVKWTLNGPKMNLQMDLQMDLNHSSIDLAGHSNIPII